MNVSCPQCKTVFRVDPRKVPTGGVRARCSVCGGVFEVSSDDDRRGAPLAVGASSPAGGASTAPQKAPAQRPAPPRPAPPKDAAPEPARPSPSQSPPSPQAPPSPAVGGGGAAPSPPAEPAEPVKPEGETTKPAAASSTPFGQPDPDARARRLARALISDLAAYNPERQERGLREGRLKELFQGDLKKCWQEYVDQVGVDLAKRTPYFRDALNEILAKGSRVF